MTNKEKKTSRRRIIKYNNHTGKFTNMFYSMANKKNKKENLKQKERKLRRNVSLVTNQEYAAPVNYCDPQGSEPRTSHAFSYEHSGDPHW